LTRFDVTRSSRVVEFVHLDLAGEPHVEEREVLTETLESVRCRWCNAVDQVELVPRPGAEGAGRAETAGSAEGADGAAQPGGAGGARQLRRRPRGRGGQWTGPGADDVVDRAGEAGEAPGTEADL